jgi:antitoxin component YwqK of YwqJK toxin-antitoxin module
MLVLTQTICPETNRYSCVLAILALTRKKPLKMTFNFLRYKTNRWLAFFLACTIVLFLLPACSSNIEEVTEQDEFGNVIRYERRKSDFAREGWAYTTSQDGVLMEAAHYVSDTLDGQRILFTETGDTSIVENYRAGSFAGPYRLYYENGKLKQAGNYVDNKMTGIWKSYHENGQLREEVLFENNLENGPFVEYHPNGKLAAEGAYLDGDSEHGELKIYNEQGELIRTMDCDRGRCTTTWSAEENQQ